MLNSMKILTLCSFLLFSLTFRISAQNTGSKKDTAKLGLSLRNVVELANNQSSALKYAQNQHVSYYWRYRNFTKQFLPNLVLSGTLPNYTQSTVPVTQPDGSIEFKQVAYLSNSSNLSLNQYIPLTGTQIYASTTFARVQDYNKSISQFLNPLYLFGENTYHKHL